MRHLTLAIMLTALVGCNGKFETANDSKKPLFSTTNNVESSGTSSCPAGWICPTNPVYTSKIGTWYLPIYDLPGSGGAYSGIWSWYAFYKPVGGEYAAADPATVQREFAAMKNAGIEFVVIDGTNLLLSGFGGDNSLTNDVTPEAIGNISSIFSADAGLPTGQQMPLAVAFGGQLAWGGPDGKGTVDGQNAEANFIYDNWASHPLYFQWFGKPLLVNYQNFANEFPLDPTWDDSRFSVRNSTAWVIAANNYAALPWEQQWAGSGYWGWIMEYPQQASTEQMTVSPGGNNLSPNNPDATYSLDRQGGILFENEWLNAIANNPKAILVSSWNGFGDGNAIEPATPTNPIKPTWTDTYGTSTPDFYLQIATAYANLRTGLMPGGYYRDVNNSTIYQVQDGSLTCQALPPPGHPVIPLPAGLLASLGAAPCSPSLQPLAYFGGTFGFGADSSGKMVTYVNPLTGSASCPTGYLAVQALGTPNQDWPVYFCYQAAASPNSYQVSDFGGMFGYGANGYSQVQYLNPSTDSSTCPAGYNDSYFIGTAYLDWPALSCSRLHTSISKSALEFGGMYGYGGNGGGYGASSAVSTFINPLTGSASCPNGYIASQVLGTSGVDWPLYFCYR